MAFGKKVCASPAVVALAFLGPSCLLLGLLVELINSELINTGFALLFCEPKANTSQQLLFILSDWRLSDNQPRLLFVRMCHFGVQVSEESCFPCTL